MAELEVSIKSFKQNFDDQLICSVCLDQYTNPKTLPCHHSFCLKCIQQLPVEIKVGKYYISCPICRIDHLVPQEGAINFPNSFQINKLLELRKQLSGSRISQPKTSSTTCPTHNDPLKVYCETCCRVICRDCTISKEHDTHNFSLISECYPKHHQQLQDSLDLVKHKLADVNTAVTHLATREKEVLQQGQQLKEQINTHAQQIIDQVQRSCTCLLQQVDTIVQKKTGTLTAQRLEAQKLHIQLKACLDMIEHSLKEWTKQQILTEKYTMIDEMNTATQHTDPVVFQPIEKANICFTKTHPTKMNIGSITSTTHVENIIELSPVHCYESAKATFTLRSFDGSPFPLPPSVISSMLCFPGKKYPVKCEVTQATHPATYIIAFTPVATQQQLMIQIGGVDNGPFTLPVIPSPEMRGKPVNTITGLNRPSSIAVCDNEDIVVTENGAHCITILTKDGRKVRSFGTNDRQFTHTCGVAISKDGCILVTDDHRLNKLTTDGICMKSVRSDRKFKDLQGIAVHPVTGEIFVADKGKKNIQVFTNDLTFSHTIALYSFIDRNNSPCDVALDTEGHLYIAEMTRVTKLTTTGQFVVRFGSPGSAPGQLSGPLFLTVNKGLVYVSEFSNNRVSIFDANGKFLNCFGKEGNGEGEFHGPSFITVDTLGINLLVGDSNNNRIVIF